MDRPCFAQRHRRVDGRVDGPVDRHQVVPADDLIELDVVHVAALAALRSMQHDQHVVAVAVHLRHAIALDAVPHREGMKAEHVEERARAAFVATGDVDPDESGVTPEQCWQFVRGPVLDALIGHQANLHVSPHRASANRASPQWSICGAIVFEIHHDRRSTLPVHHADRSCCSRERSDRVLPAVHSPALDKRLAAVIIAT